MTSSSSTTTTNTTSTTTAPSRPTVSQNGGGDDGYDYNLGSYTCPITTSSPEAQRWFDRGLIWMYGYNHEEAIDCFSKALLIDPNCAIAHWGIAYSIGPHYNKPWQAFPDCEKQETLKKVNQSITAMVAITNNNDDDNTIDLLTLSPMEMALIEALPHRYPKTKGDDDSVIPDLNTCNTCNDAYCDAMELVYKHFPNNLDVCCLYVEAMMNRTPWQLWDIKTGEAAAGASTLEAIRVLEETFSSSITSTAAWKHPGLLHMSIHIYEMSPYPERALRHGDTLCSLVPDAGHLVHMASHIDVLVGDYQNVVARNHAATIADEKFLKRNGANNFYTAYRCHNLHFKIYGALFLGQITPALQAAKQLNATIPRDYLSKPGIANWFEGFLSVLQHVYIRFGKWQDILEQTFPTDQDLYCVTTAMMHYARVVALANTKRLSEADAEKDLFLAARDKVSPRRLLFNNTCLDILAVAEQMMMGELEYHKQNNDQAFKHLRKAVELDDTMPYDEPWGWMQPARHALGALLLEQGHYDQAEAVYRADLGLDSTLPRACQHPGNVWSLHGLHECLIRRGETVEVKHVKLQLDKALARAEVPIKASCYCRRKLAT